MPCVSKLELCFDAKSNAQKVVTDYYNLTDFICGVLVKLQTLSVRDKRDSHLTLCPARLAQIVSQRCAHLTSVKLSSLHKTATTIVNPVCFPRLQRLSVRSYDDDSRLLERILQGMLTVLSFCYNANGIDMCYFFLCKVRPAFPPSAFAILASSLKRMTDF